MTKEASSIGWRDVLLGLTFLGMTGLVIKSVWPSNGNGKSARNNGYGNGHQQYMPDMPELPPNGYGAPPGAVPYQEGPPPFPQQQQRGPPQMNSMQEGIDMARNTVRPTMPPMQQAGQEYQQYEEPQQYTGVPRRRPRMA